MTAGNNGGADGTGKPEEDDPFAYLYRSEGGAAQGGTQGGQAPQPGVPRTSYNQVRPVGSRQYNQQPGGGTYGAGIPPQHQPAPHYAAPETLPGGGAPARPAPPADRPRPKRRGLLIAAIAVVLVVAGGIGTAMVMNKDGGDDKSTSAKADGSQSPSAQEKKKDDKKKGDDKPSGKPVTDLIRDASSLRLSGGASTATSVKGAPSDGGAYVVLKPGASIEWNKVAAGSGGKYTVWVDYGVPSGDVSASLWVDGQKLDRVVNLKSYGPETNWSHTYNWVQLEGGKHDIKLMCDSGSCNANVARLKLLPGWVTS
ncbi:carbohydrate-binding protein [Streptomyces luteireticuli]|uniref:carbohydrate-binding protein n=1 Tax=Streptomyces luteireticuli TaxID=173858 RepID=UPI00355604B1